jgi:hypothetical protein
MRAANLSPSPLIETTFRPHDGTREPVSCRPQYDCRVQVFAVVVFLQQNVQRFILFRFDFIQVA